MPRGVLITDECKFDSLTEIPPGYFVAKKKKLRQPFTKLLFISTRCVVTPTR